MAIATFGIHEQEIAATSFAVIDFETTGLSPGYDRAVELSVVEVSPGHAPRLVFDALINPCRRVDGTFVHGITDADVADAPRFEDIADALLRVLSGRVIVAHNAYFDMSFLRMELGRLMSVPDVPFLCTRWSRPLLGLKACTLEAACSAEQLDVTPTHTSSSDAMAAARLWSRYQDGFLARQMLRFQDLTTAGRKYKFFDSFHFDPLSHEGTASASQGPWKSRSAS